MNQVIEIGNKSDERNTARAAFARSDEVLNVDEIAAELRCSKAHVYNAINGKVSGVSALPAIHMGRRALVRRSSLEQWKQENESGRQ